MVNKKDENLKIDKKIWIIWIIVTILLVVGGQIVFFIALSRL